jgi:F-type H+-transporting ATPase subunit b
MDKERQAMRTAAQQEAQSILENTRAKIESEREKAIVDLRRQIADLAHDLALKALGNGDALAGDALRKSVNAYLDDLSPSDLEDLRKDADSTGHWLCVVTASPMPEQQKAGWSKDLHSRFGDRNIRFESDASILGGMELRFPHAVLSFSVADRLRRATEDLKV